MKTLIIDGNNVLHRTFWIATSKSNNTIHPIGLFLLSLKKLVKQFKPDQTIMTWDRRLVKDKTNYRKLLYPEYKGNRSYEGKEELFKQEINIRNILKPLGVRNMHPGILEADDVIAWLTKNIKGHKIVASADSDLYQLINTSTVVYDLNKKTEITDQDFEGKTGFTDVNEYLTIKALVGDKSDNIAGIFRCGVAGARKLIKAGLDNLPKDHEVIFERNKKMISLTAGLEAHPEECQLYDYQLKANLKPSLKSFKDACNKFKITQINDNMIEWEEVFFNKSIQSCTVTCIESLFMKNDST